MYHGLNSKKAGRRCAFSLLAKKNLAEVVASPMVWANGIPALIRYMPLVHTSLYGMHCKVHLVLEKRAFHEPELNYKLPSSRCAKLAGCFDEGSLVLSKSIDEAAEHALL